MSPPHREVHPGRALAHPLWWGALGLLVVNDHVLKALAPSPLTGKLSDLAGLVVAPFVLAASLRLRSRRTLALAFAAVVIGFSLINTAAPVARALELAAAFVGLSWRLWVDPSDLLCLPIVVVAWRVLVPRAEAARPLYRRERLGLIFGALGCLASAVPPSPTAAPGRIVAQAWGGDPLFVVDPESGERIRVLPFDDWGARTISGEVLYTATTRTVYGHRLDDGTEVLRYSSDEDRFHEGIVADERRIYLLSAPSYGRDRERALAIDLEGRLVWNADLSSRLGRRGPALAPLLASGQLVVAGEDHLVALDPASGRRLWTHRSGGPVHAIAAVGPAVFALADEKLVAIEASTGKRRWVLPVDGGQSEWHGGRRLFTSLDAVICWRRGRLVAIDPLTRGTRWIGPTIEEASVGERVAFVSLGDDRFGLLELRDGILRWTRELPHAIRVPPVVVESDGIVLVRPRAGELFAYELADGSLRFRFDLDEGLPDTSAP